ncbi:MAG: hypothetical protein J6K73_09920 [Clostridia bacterium]|nr:hypothetical protein [Clostridia bacterium]
MNKTFSRIFCILLCLLCLTLPAAAEAPAFPINPLPAFGEIPTQIALFSSNPVDYRITLQVDEETGLRTYTLHNPLDWGVDAAVPGVWEFDAENGWQRTGDLTDQQVQLVLSGDAFQGEGFPLWTVPCTDAAVNLTLTIHLGEVRHLYAYVDYEFDQDILSITAEDHSFTLSRNRFHEDGVGYDNLYASYDSSGVLAYASYSIAPADGSFTSYTIDADVAQKTYYLREISHLDAENNIFHWNSADNQWFNGTTFEPVDAPEGITPESLPFTLSGDWAGVPFAQPGDQPEGAFPFPNLTTDPALDAVSFQPWPQETDALYLHLESAAPFPALPAVSWATQEDGSFTYTLTGTAQWGVQEAHMGQWRWDEATSTWMPQPEASPGALSLSCPAAVVQSAMLWDAPTADPDVVFLLDLNRSTMLLDAGYENLATGETWQMDNQGGLMYTRPLDDTRVLEAIYDGYTLIEYNIHQSDENGNPLIQACYEPSDADPAIFELGCLFFYSQEMSYEEALWIKDIGWYSYETGAPCEAPEGVDLTQYPPLVLK